MPFSDHGQKRTSEEEAINIDHDDMDIEGVRASNQNCIPELHRPYRSPYWMHASGYLNAESYFPASHPFGRMTARMAPFQYDQFRQPVRSMSYVNAFPKSGIGPDPRVYLPPYVYRPSQTLPREHRIYPAPRPTVYPQDPRPFHPYGDPTPPTEPTEDVELRSGGSMPMTGGTPSSSSHTNDGSSETESIEQPTEHPVGTTPIFHPLPSMFHPLPRPLSFPVDGNKELPTLALFQNCSLESKVVSDYSDSHQELSLMLALPGLSAHQAPLLSIQQAGDILQAINNPLVVLKVGRLSRKLVPNPALLKPTDDVGTLALWLSPTSDVRLFWHSFLKGPTSQSMKEVEEQISKLRTQGEGSPYKELFSHVELSEELAWVAAESDQIDGGSGIRLEMMEHDPSGRSFKLTRKKLHDRQKMELASKLATEEEKAGRLVTEENQRLRQLLATCMSEDPEEEDSYFFWIAESSVSEGMQMLNTMQNRLDHLPTLSGESGVPEKKLQELYEWFSKGQQATTDSALRNELASWIDLRSGASVPSQLFSNTCPANVPNWTESQPSTSETRQATSDEQPVERTIREGCALSATANFLVADKKWGLTHLATASVMVVVGVESTGLFYDEAKAHLDLSHCAHEVAKARTFLTDEIYSWWEQRATGDIRSLDLIDNDLDGNDDQMAEAGASAEAERLGRIRLEELVAVKSLNAMRSNKSEAPSQRSELQSVGSQSEELIQRQRAMQSLYDQNQRRQSAYTAWHGPHILPGHTIQGNQVHAHAHVHAHPEIVPHVPDYLRQHIHYNAPVDHPVYQPWKTDRGYSGGQVQVLAPYQPYEHPTWSGPYHPYSWPYGNQSPYQPFVPSPPLPSFFPRHLPPQLPFLRMPQIHNHGPKQMPNLSLVRIAQEAREKVARNPRDRVRAGPSGSNLAAANIDIHPDVDDITYAWHDSAHQLTTLYRNTSLNVGRMDGDTVGETRTHAETSNNTTADDTDKM